MQLINFEDTLDAVAGVSHAAGLTPLLHDLRDAAGLANIVYHAIRIPECGEPNPILALTYDPGWVSRYTSENYFEIDPAVTTGRRGFLPIDWSALDKSSPGARHLFKEAESYGVGRQGVSIPIHGPRGERAMFSLTSNLPDEDWSRSKPQLLRDYHTMAHFFHERAVVLAGHRERKAPSLSNREQQCVQLLADGLKPKAIAHRLGISEAAVRLYTKTARHKLRCATVPQMTAKAVSLELAEA